MAFSRIALDLSSLYIIILYVTVYARTNQLHFELWLLTAKTEI